MYKKVISIVLILTFSITNLTYGMPMEWERDTLRAPGMGTPNAPVADFIDDLNGGSLIKRVEALSRAEGGIEVGRGLPDVHGRRFEPDGKFFDTPEGRAALEELESSLADSSTQAEVQRSILAGMHFYDIRSPFWMDNPAFSVLLARAYVRQLQDRSGRKDGHVIHIGVDGYQVHFDAAQEVVDTILRTGVCDNGGGIVYHGVINGGDIRGKVQLYHKLHGNSGGNWFYFTKSHRKEKDRKGAKLGMGYGEAAVVFSGSDIKKFLPDDTNTLAEYMFGGKLAELKHSTADASKIVTISDDSKHYTAVAADLIRATAAPEDTPNDKVLEGLSIFMDIKGSPLMLRFALTLEALGATVVKINDRVNPSLNEDDALDPNEQDSPAVKAFCAEFKESGCDIGLGHDPDGDRILVADIDSNGNAVAFNGTKLLLLATEGISRVFKERGIEDTATIIADMRTCLSPSDLEEALKKEGLPVEMVPTEAGYVNFMRELARLDALMAIEETCHFFTTPLTNPAFGARPEHNFPHQQGGDDAALAGILIAGLMKHRWEGRGPSAQLDWMRKEYNLRPTVSIEHKPMLRGADDEFKYPIAERMKELSRGLLPVTSQFTTKEPLSGVFANNTDTRATLLVRYSFSGPGFTLTGEGYVDDEYINPDGTVKPDPVSSDYNQMRGLGHWLFTTAVNELREEGNQFVLEHMEELDGLEGFFSPTDITKSSSAGGVNEEMYLTAERLYGDYGMFCFIDPAMRLLDVLPMREREKFDTELRSLTNFLRAFASSSTPIDKIRKELKKQKRVSAGIGIKSLIDTDSLIDLGADRTHKMRTFLFWIKIAGQGVIEKEFPMAIGVSWGAEVGDERPITRASVGNIFNVVEFSRRWHPMGSNYRGLVKASEEARDLWKDKLFGYVVLNKSSSAGDVHKQQTDSDEIILSGKDGMYCSIDPRVQLLFDEFNVDEMKSLTEQFAHLKGFLKAYGSSGRIGRIRGRLRKEEASLPNIRIESLIDMGLHPKQNMRTFLFWTNMGGWLSRRDFPMAIALLLGERDGSPEVKALVGNIPDVSDFSMRFHRAGGYNYMKKMKLGREVAEFWSDRLFDYVIQPKSSSAGNIRIEHDSGMKLSIDPTIATLREHLSLDTYRRLYRQLSLFTSELKLKGRERSVADIVNDLSVHQRLYRHIDIGSLISLSEADEETAERTFLFWTKDLGKTDFPISLTLWWTQDAATLRWLVPLPTTENSLLGNITNVGDLLDMWERGRYGRDSLLLPMKPDRLWAEKLKAYVDTYILPQKSSSAGDIRKIYKTARQLSGNGEMFSYIDPDMQFAYEALSEAERDHFDKQLKFLKGVLSSSYGIREPIRGIVEDLARESKFLVNIDLDSFIHFGQKDTKAYQERTILFLTKGLGKRDFPMGIAISQARDKDPAKAETLQEAIGPKPKILIGNIFNVPSFYWRWQNEGYVRQLKLNESTNELWDRTLRAQAGFQKSSSAGNIKVVGSSGMSYNFDREMSDIARHLNRDTLAVLHKQLEDLRGVLNIYGKSESIGYIKEHLSTRESEEFSFIDIDSLICITPEGEEKEKTFLFWTKGLADLDSPMVMTLWWIRRWDGTFFQLSETSLMGSITNVPDLWQAWMREKHPGGMFSRLDKGTYELWGTKLSKRMGLAKSSSAGEGATTVFEDEDFLCRIDPSMQLVFDNLDKSEAQMFNRELERLRILLAEYDLTEPIEEVRKALVSKHGSDLITIDLHSLVEFHPDLESKKREVLFWTRDIGALDFPIVMTIQFVESKGGKTALGHFALTGNIVAAEDFKKNWAESESVLGLSEELDIFWFKNLTRYSLAERLTYKKSSSAGTEQEFDGLVKEYGRVGAYLIYHTTGDLPENIKSVVIEMAKLLNKKDATSIGAAIELLTILPPELVVDVLPELIELFAYTKAEPRKPDGPFIPNIKETIIETSSRVVPLIEDSDKKLEVIDGLRGLIKNKRKENWLQYPISRAIDSIGADIVGTSRIAEAKLKLRLLTGEYKLEGKGVLLEDVFSNEETIKKVAGRIKISRQEPKDYGQSKSSYDAEYENAIIELTGLISAIAEDDRTKIEKLSGLEAQFKDYNPDPFPAHDASEYDLALWTRHYAAKAYIKVVNSIESASERINIVDRLTRRFDERSEKASQNLEYECLKESLSHVIGPIARHINDDARKMVILDKLVRLFDHRSGWTKDYTFKSLVDIGRSLEDESRKIELLNKLVEESFSASSELRTPSDHYYGRGAHDGAASHKELLLVAAFLIADSIEDVDTGREELKRLTGLFDTLGPHGRRLLAASRAKTEPYSELFREREEFEQDIKSAILQPVSLETLRTHRPILDSIYRERHAAYTKPSSAGELGKKGEPVITNVQGKGDMTIGVDTGMLSILRGLPDSKYQVFTDQIEELRRTIAELDFAIPIEEIRNRLLWKGSFYRDIDLDSIIEFLNDKGTVTRTILFWTKDREIDFPIAMTVSLLRLEDGRTMIDPESVTGTITTIPTLHAEWVIRDYGMKVLGLWEHRNMLWLNKMAEYSAVTKSSSAGVVLETKVELTDKLEKAGSLNDLVRIRTEFEDLLRRRKGLREDSVRRTFTEAFQHAKARIIEESGEHYFGSNLNSGMLIAVSGFDTSKGITGHIDFIGIDAKLSDSAYVGLPTGVRKQLHKVAEFIAKRSFPEVDLLRFELAELGYEALDVPAEEKEEPIRNVKFTTIQQLPDHEGYHGYMMMVRYVSSGLFGQRTEHAVPIVMYLREGLQNNYSGPTYKLRIAGIANISEPEVKRMVSSFLLSPIENIKLSSAGKETIVDKRSGLECEIDPTKPFLKRLSVDERVAFSRQLHALGRVLEGLGKTQGIGDILDHLRQREAMVPNVNVSSLIGISEDEGAEGIVYAVDRLGHQIRALDRRTGKELMGFGFPSNASDIDVSGGKIYASDWKRRSIRAYYADTREEVPSFNASEFKAYDIVVPSGGDVFFAADRDGEKIRVLDKATGRELFAIKGLVASDMAFSEEDRILYFSDSASDEIRAIDMSTRQVIKGFVIGGLSTGAAKALALLEDTIFVVDKARNTVRAFDRRTREEKEDFDAGFLAAADITGFGDTLFVVDWHTEKIIALDKDTGKARQEFAAARFLATDIAIPEDYPHKRREVPGDEDGRQKTYLFWTQGLGGIDIPMGFTIWWTEEGEKNIVREWTVANAPDLWKNWRPKKIGRRLRLNDRTEELWNEKLHTFVMHPIRQKSSSAGDITIGHGSSSIRSRIDPTLPSARRVLTKSEFDYFRKELKRFGEFLKRGDPISPLPVGALPLNTIRLNHPQEMGIVKILSPREIRSYKYIDMESLMSFSPQYEDLSEGAIKRTFLFWTKGMGEDNFPIAITLWWLIEERRPPELKYSDNYLLGEITNVPTLWQQWPNRQVNYGTDFMMSETNEFWLREMKAYMDRGMKKAYDRVRGEKSSSAGQEDLAKVKQESRLAAEIAKLGVPGTIVFNDRDLSAGQRDILMRILGRDTGSLQELERVMGSTIRLISQIRPEDIKGPMIIISDEKLSSYPDARYLLFKQVAEIDNSYLPVMPMIAMAKGLLNLKDTSQVDLIKSIGELSRALLKRPLEESIIEEYIRTGTFNLQLPKPEIYDYELLEQLQKAAFEALIAA